MCYRNELFYRLHSIDIRHRARLYHYACRLAQRDRVVVSATDASCSIWVSLRSSHVQESNLHLQKLPSFMHLADEEEDQP